MPEHESEFIWKGRTGPFTLLITPKVFAPTHTSRAIAEAMEINPGETVVDVGCGTGVLGFVAARLGARYVYGSDLTPEAVAVAEENARRLGLDDVMEFRTGSLLEPVRDVQADVVIGDVSGIPDEVAAATNWFPGGKGGGPTGAELPIAMLDQMDGSLVPGGRVYLPTGSIQNEGSVLAAARRVFGAANLERIMQKELPLPDIAARSKAVLRMMGEGLINLRRHGSRLLWNLSVWRCVRPLTVAAV